VNANEVIAAHRAWKETLRMAMATRERLDLVKISSDNSCQFGEWLYSAECTTQFGHLPEYSQCLADHAAFHRAAGKVAEAINAGDLLNADKMMASGTHYAHTSETLSISVKAMFHTVE
jgi:methyl-accepting chemotaxis protein